MEKPTWRRIEKNSSKPCPRWGHASCTIHDQVLFFGGYADSNYMNDLWTYHATQKVWTEVNTSGTRPSHRSNCTLTYNTRTNEVIVFGGGGPNKQRFNSISVLNWETKEWREIVPRENEAAPWERTYHVAQLCYPYLVVFGGEGLADMEDLWAFNFQTERWTEIKIDKNSSRPCARRFHSSCMIGNQFFVVAGCHGKYRCLSDVFSLDLTPLLETGKGDELRWVERKLKGASFLSRWGHSSVVFDGKIYVFAGRFSSDLNDVLVIDVANNTMKGLRIGGNSGDYPKPRRRHCASFVGSCMMIFGGFNGEYFNDLYYINVFELTSKTPSSEEGALQFLNSQQLSDSFVSTSEGQKVPVHEGALAKLFSTKQALKKFLGEINNKFTKEQLLDLLEAIYKGHGKSSILPSLGVSLPEGLNRRWLLNELIREEPNETNVLAVAHKSFQKTTEMIVSLKKEEFERLVERRRELWYIDSSIRVGKSSIPVNRQQICMSSPYFRHLLSSKFSKEAELPLPATSPIVVEMLVGALTMGVLAVPLDYSLGGWMELAQLTDYFCLNGLKSACEAQLCSKVSQDNYQELERLAEEVDMPNLSLYCASYVLKSQLLAEQSPTACKLRGLMRLELAHQGLETNKSEGIPLKKGVSQVTSTEEKQNNRECSNI